MSFENLHRTKTAQVGLPYLDCLIWTAWSKIFWIGWISEGICRQIRCIDSLDYFPVMLIFIFMCDSDRMLSISAGTIKLRNEWRIIKKYCLKLLRCIKWEQVNHFKIVVHITNTHLGVMRSVQQILSVSRKSRQKNILSVHRYCFEEFNWQWSFTLCHLINLKVRLSLRDDLCPVRWDSKNVLHGAILNRAELFDFFVNYLVDTDVFSRFISVIKPYDESVWVGKEIYTNYWII